ncbi:MAG: GNAT family N-acetyltransferase [Pseudonocardiaceae bacterium]
MATACRVLWTVSGGAAKLVIVIWRQVRWSGKANVAVDRPSGGSPNAGVNSSRETTLDGMIVRMGTFDDLPELTALNSLCFSAAADHREPVAPEELKSAAESGHILLCVNEQRILGFLRYELPVEHHLCISALAVHPDYWRLGIATRLLDSIIDADATADQLISVVIAPDDYPMLRLLFSRRFVAPTVMNDYFGPGLHGFYCQRKGGLAYLEPDERFVILARAWGNVLQLLQAPDHVVTGVADLSTGVAFEISRFERDNLAALRSNEISSGVAFSGSILAAITFLLGFSFTSPNYPDSVRVVLIGATFASTLALIIYTNASGSFACLRSNTFDRHMEWATLYPNLAECCPC